jgi:polyhydroxyalkanoate synthesis regulator phasin
VLGDLLRRGFVTGLGLAWVTKEKAEELVGEWVRQGRVSLEQSREAVDRLLKEAEEQRGELLKVINAQIGRGIEAAGLAKAQELKAVEERLAKLEHLLRQTSRGQEPPEDGNS